MHFCCRRKVTTYIHPSMRKNYDTTLKNLLSSITNIHLLHSVTTDLHQSTITLQRDIRDNRPPPLFCKQYSGQTSSHNDSSSPHQYVPFTHSFTSYYIACITKPQIHLYIIVLFLSSYIIITAYTCIINLKLH